MMVTLRPTRGALVIVLLAGAFFIASRTTGAGWLTVLIAIALGVLIVGAVTPWWQVRKVVVAVSAPTDALAGRAFDIDITVEEGSHIEMTPMHPAGETFSVASPTTGSARVVAPRRGLVATVALEASSAAPFGLVWARRTLEIPLSHPIEVAPRVTPVRLPAVRSISVPGDDTRGKRHGQGETVRTIREYVPGDSMRLMHWPATARADQPIVKELEAPDAPRLVVRVDLNTEGEEAERRASAAAGLVQAGLASGLPVSLHTAEPGGPHAGSVGSMLEAGRRLARAVAGPLPPPTHDARSTVVVAGVT